MNQAFVWGGGHFLDKSIVFVLAPPPRRGVRGGQGLDSRLVRAEMSRAKDDDDVSLVMMRLVMMLIMLLLLLVMMIMVMLRRLLTDGASRLLPFRCHDKESRQKTSVSGFLSKC